MMCSLFSLLCATHFLAGRDQQVTVTIGEGPEDLVRHAIGMR